MPTGGVSAEEENLRGWFAAGVSCVGMGSKLFSKELMQSRSVGDLEERVREALATIRRLR